MLIELTISSNIKKLIAGLSLENIQGAMKAGMVNLISDVEARAVKLAPVRTSNLANAITNTVAPDGLMARLFVTNAAPYAKYVHEGTGLYGPHKQKIVIMPKNKKALFWPGAKHPVRKVEQKGIKGNPFFKKALREIKPSALFSEGVKNFLLRRLK